MPVFGQHVMMSQVFNNLDVNNDIYPAASNHLTMNNICIYLSNHLEMEWEQLVKNFSNHITSSRCYEITQKGFLQTGEKLQNEDKDTPSHSRQLSK